jgi:hypothetical protein
MCVNRRAAGEPPSMLFDAGKELASRSVGTPAVILIKPYDS